MKVLLFGSRYYRFNQGIAAALKLSGQRVHLLSYRDIRYRKLSSRNPYKRKKAFYRQGRINRQLLQAAETFRPDTILTWGGNIILPSTLIRLRRRGIKLVLWLLDTIDKLRQTQEGLSRYHLVYTLEPGDLDFIGKLNSRVTYLPPAYDPEVYHPLPPPAVKKYELAFVGNHWGREEFLREMADFSSTTSIRLALVGKYWHRGISSLRRLERWSSVIKRVVIYNGQMDPIDVNRIYQQSKIVLNNHRGRSGAGINPRLFDIAGSGAFQLVDFRETLFRAFLPGEEMISYNSISDLKGKINYFLERPEERKKFAAAAERRARRDHTYQRRLEKILEDIARL